MIFPGGGEVEREYITKLSTFKLSGGGRWKEIISQNFPNIQTFRRGGGGKRGAGEENITKLSTFKPKPLRNPATNKQTEPTSERTKRK